MPRTPIRARAGLVMRPGMDWQGLTPVEQAFQAEGVSLAPMAVSNAPMSTAQGLSILPTATVQDLESGGLVGLVVPEASDAGAAGQGELDKLMATAREKGVPILALGEAAREAATALGLNNGRQPGAIGSLIGGREATPIDSPDQVALAAAAL
ncbi:hypothetical protein Q0812_12700 [Brevundimonas sp. 2R-24]|uniref:Uncharacterized protein n=1 Tax=Peiella sedimenti TaxID=3061083 RepID=A0ABT8SP71_9CAUL|nr:hypothetical protein [Caulobacteraceae bacterium XZ-24]